MFMKKVVKTDFVVGKRQKPEDRHLYKFVYDNKKRLALFLEDEGDGMLCWDFTVEDYRRFKYNKIDCVQDVTESMKVETWQSANNKGFDDLDYTSEGCRLFVDESLEMYYIVRLKGVNVTAS